MRKLFLGGLIALSCFFTLNLAYAQIQNAPMKSTVQTNPTIERTSPSLERPKQNASHVNTTQSDSLPVSKPIVEVSQTAEYLHPGILVYLNDRWQGSDHLLNLTNNISVYVTIVKPETENIDISHTELQKEVEKIFMNGNIKPQTIAAVGKAPLPVFEIEIFIYPIDKGFVACCDGRLMESVVLERFKMDPNMAFQAITWEKQSLIVSPKALFNEQMTKNVKEIAEAFVERYQTYEKLKKTL